MKIQVPPGVQSLLKACAATLSLQRWFCWRSSWITNVKLYSPLPRKITEDFWPKVPRPVCWDPQESFLLHWGCPCSSMEWSKSHQSFIWPCHQIEFHNSWNIHAGKRLHKTDFMTLMAMIFMKVAVLLRKESEYFWRCCECILGGITLPMESSCMSSPKTWWGQTTSCTGTCPTVLLNIANSFGLQVPKATL